MLAVLGENDGLAQPVATLHFDAVLHELSEHHVDGLLVVHEPVQLLRGREVRGISCLRLLPVVVVALAVLLRELVVSDAVGEEGRVGLDVVVGNEYMILVHSCIVLVEVGGDTALHVEEVVGVAINLILGRSSEPNHRRIEVVKNRPVILEDGTVGFIHDHEVEVRGRVEPAIAVIPHLVDGVEDRGVCGENHPRIGIFLFV